jgi:hypothetical protein
VQVLRAVTTPPADIASKGRLMTSHNNDWEHDMNAQPSPSGINHDRHSVLITDAVLDPPARTECIFPYLFAKGQLTVVSMNAGVDGAYFASVCAVKAASGGALPMFGKGAGLNVNLLIGGIDKDMDADTYAFHDVLLAEESALCDPSQWVDRLRTQRQGKDGWGALYLNTKMGFLKFRGQLEPNSLTVIYDLGKWLRAEGLTVETASELLEKLQRACIGKGVTLVIFERHSSENNTLAAAIATTSEVLQLVSDKKAPAVTGYGCSLLRKRRGIFDAAPRACSFWISLTDAGNITWGMEPSTGPQLAEKELDAVQRRILTAKWKSGEHTPRQIAELLGKNPDDYPDKLDQQGIAKLLNVSPATTSRDLKAIQQKRAPHDA